MGNETKLLGDVNHICVIDEETQERTLIACGDWTKAEELGVTDYAKEVWTEELLEKFANMQASLEATQYQRDRQAEYPSVQELVVALYDTDDKSAIEAKRAEVKKKYPKPE